MTSTLVQQTRRLGTSLPTPTRPQADFFTSLGRDFLMALELCNSCELSHMQYELGELKTWQLMLYFYFTPVKS